MSKIKLLYQLKVTDKNGNVIQETLNKECNSFLLQFLQLLEVQMYPSLNVTIKDYLDADNSIADDALNFCSEFPAASAIGIMVGTGTTAVTLSDYKLETALTHGVGAGNISYGATSKTTTAISGTNVDFILTRTFNNGTGNTINVTEAGIVCKCAGTLYPAIVREVFAPVAVADGQTLTVNFTLRTAL